MDERTFDPIEHAILRRYFGLAPLPDTPGLWVPETGPRDDDGQALDGGPKRLQTGLEEDVAVANAVARMCLDEAHGLLPTWDACLGDGTWVHGRSPEPRTPRPERLKPVFLFEINWADSGPGYSWPEAYFVTLVPGYDRWVVTLSDDSTDTWGVNDLAIGHFADGGKLLQECRAIVTAHWRSLDIGDEEYTGWAYLFRVGRVTSASAYRWRRLVWPTAPMPKASRRVGA